MYRGYDNKEEWERNRWNLVQSLFDNAPTLSPIPEETEPRPRSLDSPTDLKIEIVPKRPNVDDTEEFYDQLEEEIRDYMRRDNYIPDRINFNEAELNDSEKNEFNNDDSSETYKIPQLSDPEDYSLDRKSSTESKGVEDEIRNDIERLSNDNDSIPIDENNYAKLNVQEELEEDNASETDEILQFERVEVDESKEFRDVGENSDSLLKLASKEGASYADEAVKTPELMRKHRSLHHHSIDVYKFPSTDTSVSNKSSFNCSPDIDEPLTTSTPKVSRKRKITTKSDSITRMRESSERGSVSNISECTANYIKIYLWKKIIAKKPVVFKLCTCEDHACT